MKSLNIRNEGSNNNTNTENNANNSAGISTSRLQNLANKIEEPKGKEAQTPSPKKAPLNYIDNMGEWEEAQKKYEKEISQKQQELMAILGAYEDKTEETNRFRIAKSELEIELGKTMGTIIDKLQDYDDFLLQIYTKIYESTSDNSETNELEQTENINDNELEETEVNTQNLDDEMGNEKNTENTRKSILDFLSSLGIEFKILPQNLIEQENINGVLLDNAKEEITRFLNLNQHGNREKYKKSLEKIEIEGVENLYNSIKKHCENYIKLTCQIDLIEAKIEKLENEENILYTSYNNGVKEAKEMGENMENLNETYFLNSYLSTKSASIDNFVSAPLVEKQISNIIELNKQGKPIPKTILLCGRLNSGKSYAANILATELGRKMYHIKSYDIFTGGFSDPNAMLDTIFTGAIKKKEPCIIFLDEIESYTQGYDGSPYEKLLENTIRHHVSKIRESNLDIMVIGAISDKKKVSPDLFKQDVFSQQIFFTGLSKEKAEVLFRIIIREKGIKLGDDVNIHKLFEKRLKNTHVDPEYMKKIISFTIDFSKLNKSGDSENITLSLKDFNDAIDYIERNINASKLGYYLSMTPR